MKKTMTVKLGAGDLKALMRGDGIPLTIRGFDEILLGYDRQRHRDNGAASTKRKQRFYSKALKNKILAYVGAHPGDSMSKVGAMFKVPGPTIWTWNNKKKKA